MSGDAHCVVCGVMHQILRFCNSSTMKEMTLMCFKPGKFSYASIMGRGDSETLFICKHCSLFYKRIVSTPAKHRVKRYLPVDQVFSFMTDPSSVPVPDIRVMRRILSHCQLKRKNSLFSNFFVSFPHIRAILRMISEKRKSFRGELSDVDIVAFVWWEMNGKPVILQNVSTAKYVRQAMKKNLQQSSM